MELDKSIKPILTKQELKNVLKNVLKACDTNNQKYELNYIYIDKEYIVATNTRAMALYKHGIQSLKKPFYIHQSTIKEALKNTKAIEYRLNGHESITAIDKDELELLTYSNTTIEYFRESFKYPDYERVIPEETKHKKVFLNKEQIGGILASHEVNVNPKYLPDFDSGFVHWNESNLPILTISEDKRQMYVSMPIADDRFEELKKYLK